MQCTTYHGVEFAGEGRESSRVPATCSVQHTMALSSLVMDPPVLTELALQTEEPFFTRIIDMGTPSS